MTGNRTTDLLPCPFCGCKAYIAEIASGGIVTAYTTCCNAIGKCIASDLMRYYATEAEAVEAWNTRAELVSGECEQEERGWSTEGDHARVWLTCGHDCMVPTVQDLPSFCPNCGKAVKR